MRDANSGKSWLQSATQDLLQTIKTLAGKTRVSSIPMQLDALPTYFEAEIEAPRIQAGLEAFSDRTGGGVLPNAETLPVQTLETQLQKANQAPLNTPLPLANAFSTLSLPLQRLNFSANAQAVTTTLKPASNPASNKPYAAKVTIPSPQNRPVPLTHLQAPKTHYASLINPLQAPSRALNPNWAAQFPLMFKPMSATRFSGEVRQKFRDALAQTYQKQSTLTGSPPISPVIQKIYGPLSLNVYQDFKTNAENQLQATPNPTATSQPAPAVYLTQGYVFQGSQKQALQAIVPSNEVNPS
ncbi:MAG: hypothetical protein VKJ06_02540 [Vampirovibrionales bacterium]|nr:hypothetical protein [Vampirovibrionales bacterium]